MEEKHSTGKSKNIYIVNEAMMQAFLDDIGIHATVTVNVDNGYTEIKTEDYTYLVTSEKV